MGKIINKMMVTAFMLMLIPCMTYANAGGTIKGSVFDKNTNTPLLSATIQVYSISDSNKLVTGGTTDANGYFEISDIPYGNYNVKISYIGYSNAYIKNIQLSSDAKIKDIGQIKLSQGSEVTDVIEVTTEAPIMTIEGDKKIFDVKKDITSQSGSVIDVLKNIPNVTVDDEGNVSLRGNSNVKILIDGKPSAMLSNGSAPLMNIPGNVVEKIEVINNPSAKYEAEGVSGIINIVMKKNEIGGFNGNIKSNAGTEDKYNISATTNYKSGPFGLAFVYSFWNYAVPGVMDLYRTNFFSENSRYISENANWKYRGRSNYTSLGIDYDLDKTNSLSFIFTGIAFNRLRNIGANYNTFDFNNNFNSNYKNFTNSDNTGYTLDFSLSHTKKFEEKGHEITTIGSYSKRQENAYQDITGIFTGMDPILNKQSNGYNFNFLNFQSDYTKPFGEDMNLEAGVKYNLRKIDGYQDYYNNINNVWIPNEIRNNNVDAIDYIAGIYSTYQYKLKNFTIKAGLRGEYTMIDYKFQNNTLNVDKNYFDLFPSLSLSQKVGDNNQFQLSYNRRINRPNINNLNPFKDYSDPNNVMSGNPNLNPEYINSFELSYTRYFPFASITPTIFYRRTTDNIMISQSMDSSGVSYVMPQNLGNTNSYGIEMMIQGGLAKWWTMSINGSYYRNDLTGMNGMQNIDRSDYSWTTRFNSNMAIPDICDVQFSYMYFGKQYTVQGSIEPFQMMSLSLSKSFFDKRLIVAFRINDLFNQQKFSIAYAGTGFTNDFSNKSNSRAAFLTLTYNFGKDNSTNKKIQRKQREMEGEIQQSN